MKDCLFCHIAADPDKVIWENDGFAAFRDIHPKAPVHVLVVPKQHYDNLDAVQDPEVLGAFLQSVQNVAHDQGVAGNYRVILNTGPHAGMVDHLHAHILGGKPLDDYPR